MELLLCIDALKRSSAKNITAVIPYFGYARQDRKVVPRTSISAKLVSNLITQAGADRVVTVDLHAGQIQGFFDIPVDNLFTTPLFARHIKKKIKSKNIICVAPDVGGVERSRALGRILNVASVAAFFPGPNLAAYYASKAFVLSFSEALNHELRNTKVTVTTLCPGPTKSNFFERAGVKKSPLMEGFLIPHMSAFKVALKGF